MQDLTTIMTDFEQLSLEQQKMLTIQYLEDYQKKSTVLRNIAHFLATPHIIVNSYILKRIYYHLLCNEENVLAKIEDEEKVHCIADMKAQMAIA